MGGNGETLLLLCCVSSCNHAGILCFQVLQRPTSEQKQQLAVHSKHVAMCVTELVQTAEAMKGEAGNTHSTHKQKLGFKTFSHV